MKNTKNKLKYALIAMLPSIDAYESFIADNTGIVIESIVKYAFNHQIISEKTQQALKQFIINNYVELLLPNIQNLTLEDYKTKLSPFRDKTDEINDLKDKMDLKFKKIPYTIHSILTKGKFNTVTKRNAARMISFYICNKETELLSLWNYDKLKQLFEKNNEPINEGVRIAFALISSGDEITFEMLDWLKKEIKDCLHDKNLRIASFNLTSYYLDFNHTIDISFLHPNSYRKCTNDAISLAYQISIRWSLSKYTSYRIYLSIGLAVGFFSHLNKYLDILINVKLPENPIIRMTDYTRQCVLINDIRLFFCNNPKEENIYGGETINIWWVTGFWNTLYWDFVPAMLKEPTLNSNQILNKLLWSFGDDSLIKEDITKQPNSLLTFFQHPQQTILGMEIAKILFYRKKLFEALEILRIIICRDPNNLVAKTLRITIYWNIAIEASSYSIAKNFFDRADEEATVIDENHIRKDEDFYSEYSFAKLAHAITIMKLIKNNAGTFETEEGIELNKTNVFKLLEEIECLYKKSMAISPTGNCSLYWLLCICSIKKTLLANQGFFTTLDYKLEICENIFLKTAENLFIMTGWLRKDYPKDIQLNYIKTRMLHAIDTYDNSVSLRTYIPNLKICYAVFVWDFSYEISYDTAIQILQWLYEAIDLAEQLEIYKLCIYTSIRFCGSILQPIDFIKNVKKIIFAIENKIGKLEDIKTKTNAEKNKMIDRNLTSDLKICLLNL